MQIIIKLDKQAMKFAIFKFLIFTREFFSTSRASSRKYVGIGWSNLGTFLNKQGNLRSKNSLTKILGS